ncbi:MAG: cupin domain-containing protein [Alphaproteobacteria bacterium]
MSNRLGEEMSMKLYRTLLAAFFPLLLITTSGLAMMRESDPEALLAFLKPLPENLPKDMSEEDISYEVVPATAGLNYRISMFDIAGPVEGHYHEHQTQQIVVLEGKLEVQLNRKTLIILEPPQSICIPPTVWHALKPMGGLPVRYLSTYFFDATIHPTGLPFPEDVNFSEKK